MGDPVVNAASAAIAWSNDTSSHLPGVNPANATAEIDAEKAVLGQDEPPTQDAPRIKLLQYW
jgi:hypothetical protein